MRGKKSCPSFSASSDMPAICESSRYSLKIFANVRGITVQLPKKIRKSTMEGQMLFL